MIPGHLGGVAYPQANEQVENANQTMLDEIKNNSTTQVKIGWKSCQTFFGLITHPPMRATEDLPISLTYGFEARLPTKAHIPTAQEEGCKPKENEEAMKVKMEFRDKRCDRAAIKMSKYHQIVKAYHDTWVKPRYFCVRDQVLR